MMWAELGLFLTLSTRAQEGYSSQLVCSSVSQWLISKMADFSAS